MKNHNFNLFFYGLWGLLIQAVGGFILSFGGIFMLFFSFLNGGGYWFGLIVCLVLGIGLLLYGKAVRFDYQRNSGNIIHRGDW